MSTIRAGWAKASRRSPSPRRGNARRGLGPGRRRARARASSARVPASRVHVLVRATRSHARVRRRAGHGRPTVDRAGRGRGGRAPVPVRQHLDRRRPGRAWVRDRQSVGRGRPGRARVRGWQSVDRGVPPSTGRARAPRCGENGPSGATVRAHPRAGHARPDTGRVLGRPSEIRVLRIRGRVRLPPNAVGLHAGEATGAGLPRARAKVPVAPRRKPMDRENVGVPDVHNRKVLPAVAGPPARVAEPLTRGAAQGSRARRRSAAARAKGERASAATARKSSVAS